MIRILEKTALLAVLLLTLGAGSARAATIETKIPFDFVVGARTFPAGTYLVEHNDDEPGVLLIRGRDHARDSAFILVEPSGDHDPAGDRGALRFTRKDARYWLRDVWSSRNQGWEIESSPAAR